MDIASPDDQRHPLVAYRQARGMSRSQLARLLDVSRMTVWRWEETGREIELEVLPRVVERTGIPARELRRDLAELLTAGAEPTQ